MKRVVIALAGVVGCLAANGGSFLKDGDRWILSGDSITSTDTYRQILQLALDHYHPGNGVVVGNRGVWGQKLSEEKKLGKGENPQVVSVMIAMNSFIHAEYGTATDFSKKVEAHVEGLRKKIREYKAKGASVLLLTPTLTDEREGSFFVTYNATQGLVEVGDAIRTLANEEGCFLVPAAEELEEYKDGMGPRETFIPDGVHPYGHGQYAIANSLLKRMNFAGELTGTRRLTEKEAEPLGVTCETERAVRTGTPIKLGTDGVNGKLRWSAWCDSLRLMRDEDKAGRCIGRGECGLDGEMEWTAPVEEMVKDLRVGERMRLMVDVTPEDGKSRLFCLDLAKVRVVAFGNGKASGTVTAAGRNAGETVCEWTLEENGADLWMRGKIYGCEWGTRPYGAWANVFGMNGVQMMFDFRPSGRFGGINTDRDAPMILLAMTDVPHFGVMPLAWMGRRYQNALFAHGERTAEGAGWTLGFRGNVTDCEAFDVRKLDCFGVYMLVKSVEEGRTQAYTDAPYSPKDNPERRMNQMTIFDRKGKFGGDAEAVTVNFYAFR